MARRHFRTEDPVIEHAEFVGRTVEELCRLLRSQGDYREVSERIERTRGALETLRVTLWQRELVRAVTAGRRIGTPASP